MTFRARFIPKNPHKYLGDASNIWARSRWEITVMKYFDSRKNVLQWGSEEISIPYLSPLDNKVHSYYPDFIVKYKNANDEINIEIIEVKPLHESDANFAKSERSKDALKVNQAKWKAASIYCESQNMTFRVLTEQSIFHQVEKKRKKKNEPL